MNTCDQCAHWNRHPVVEGLGVCMNIEATSRVNAYSGAPFSTHRDFGCPFHEQRELTDAEKIAKHFREQRCHS